MLQGASEAPHRDFGAPFNPLFPRAPPEPAVHQGFSPQDSRSRVRFVI